MPSASESTAVTSVALPIASGHFTTSSGGAGDREAFHARVAGT